MKTYLLLVIGLVIGISGGWLLLSSGKLNQLVSNFKASDQQSTQPGLAANAKSPNAHDDFHEHLDLRVVIGGKPLDLAVPEYQSSMYIFRDPQIHLHDSNGLVVHLHRAGVTLGELLKTLNIELTEDCLVVMSAETLGTATGSGALVPSSEVVSKNCLAEGDDNSLAVVVNGVSQQEKAAYQVKDLDKVVVYFGKALQELIDAEVAKVSDEACLYSETCPERGKPPVENCTASADVPCVVAP